MGEKQKIKNYVGLILATFSSCGLISMIGTYLSFVYTEYIGVSAAIVGVVLAVGIIIDGISDFAMGLIMDNTHSRHGKARPWFRWMAFPIMVSMVLIFMVPLEWSVQAKTIWLFVTYNLYCTFLTAARIPASSLVALVSDTKESRATAAYIDGLSRQFGNTISTTIIGILVTAFGGGILGYRITDILVAVTIAICLLSSFYLIREVNQEEAAKEAEKNKESRKVEKGKLWIELKSVLSNRYWLIQEFGELSVSIGTGFLTGALAYFCNFVLGNMAITMSILAAVLSFGMLAGIVFWGPVMRKIDAAKLTSVSCLFAAFGYVISAVGWFCFHSTFVVYAGLAVKQFFSGPYFISGSDLTARTVIYCEYKTGMRQTGLCYSGKSVLQKICSALASAIVGFFLTAVGYVGGGEAVSQSTANGIAILYLIVPIAFWILASFAYGAFKLDNHEVDRMKQEIEKRKRNAEMNMRS